jgi:molybdate transport system ATP-binding protein
MRFDLNFAFATRDSQLPFKLEINHQWDAKVTGIYGHSGGGKSSLVEVLLGLKSRALVRGHCRVGSALLFATAEGVWLSTRERRCAWVPQEAALLPHLSSLGNIKLTAKTGADLDAVITALQLEGLLSKKPRQLSGGERQRVALARALLAPHDMLVLDEPLAALDSAQRLATLEFLRRRVAVENTPMWYVSHRWDEILTICDHAMVIEEGRLRWHGPPRLWAEAKSEYNSQ